jgi:outer membrane protein|tara:strand:+ start:222 stop:752 length:531 start_codon:yes stop_codon:yes gene_type:complete
MSIKKISIYLISLFIFFYPNIVLSDNNIYYVDIDYLMNNSLAGKSIIIKLDEKTKFNKKKFEESEKNLQKEETRIISKKNILSKEEYIKEVQLFKKKVKDYKLSRNRSINQISKIKNDAQRTLIESLTPILADYANKNSISYIIPKQNIIIGKKELDITNSILEILNSKIKNIKIQ